MNAKILKTERENVSKIIVLISLCVLMAALLSGCEKSNAGGIGKGNERILNFMFVAVDDADPLNPWFLSEPGSGCYMTMSVNDDSEYIQYDFSDIYVPNAYATMHQSSPSGDSIIYVYSDGGDSSKWAEIHITYSGDTVTVVDGSCTLHFELCEEDRGKRLKEVSAD